MLVDISKIILGAILAIMCFFFSIILIVGLAQLSIGQILIGMLAAPISGYGAWWFYSTTDEVILAGTPNSPRDTSGRRLLTRSPGQQTLDESIESQKQGISGTITLDQLKDMDPYEFERFVTRLLRHMGMRAETTVASGDGGVDIRAVDPRPILGGRYIVQVKRYQGTVGPSYVRDLFGTMMHEHLTKGVMITTGNYGPTAIEFARGKGIDLIDGHELMDLIRRTSMDIAA